MFDRKRIVFKIFCLGVAGAALLWSSNVLGPYLVNPMTTLGDLIYGGSSPAEGSPARLAGNTTALPLCLIETGDGVNATAPVWSACPSQSTVTYYLQNSVLSSGTYTSGGSITGTVGQTCTLTAFNGGGSGATATVALTGSNVIAGGTAITVTAAGTQYTSAPTSATLGNGTATCSGTATIATVLNVPASNKSGYFQQLTSVYAPKSDMAFPGQSGSGTVTLANFITPPGVPNLASIPAGAYTFHIHASRTNPFSGTAAIQCAFVEVDSAGNDIAVIGTSEATPQLTSLEVQYTLEFADSNAYTMASTSSRIVARVQTVNVTILVSSQIDLYIGGEADSHIVLPSTTVDSSTFVPYVGATADLNLGTHNLFPNTLYTNAEYNNGTCTTAATINPANGNRQKVTLTNAQTCALTFTQPAGSTVSIQLKIIQSTSSSFNGTISGGKWPGGAAPTITATSGAIDIVTCYLDGTSAYCVSSQNFS